MVRRRPGLLAVAIALAVAACGPIPGGGPEPAPIGVAAGPAPSWSLLVRARDLDGHVVGEAPGRATIAVVFASWCGHCRAEIAELARVIGRDDVRVVGINFRQHEAYDDRGDLAAVRAYVVREAPWLEVVPAGDDLWGALGAPPKIPVLLVYDAGGVLRAAYDRRDRSMPDARELAELLDQI